jgi:hypothetical protein
MGYNDYEDYDEDGGDEIVCRGRYSDPPAHAARSSV